MRDKNDEPTYTLSDKEFEGYLRRMDDGKHFYCKRLKVTINPKMVSDTAPVSGWPYWRKDDGSLVKLAVSKNGENFFLDNGKGGHIMVSSNATNFVTEDEAINDWYKKQELKELLNDTTEAKRLDGPPRRIA